MRPTRPITFTCDWCYREVTEERAPGPTPTYCRGCKAEVVRFAGRERARKFRERQALVNPPRRGPGRPRK